MAVKEFIEQGSIAGSSCLFGEIIRMPEFFNRDASTGLLKVAIKDRSEPHWELTILFPQSISRDLSFIRLQDILAFRGPLKLTNRIQRTLVLEDHKIPEMEVHTASSNYGDIIAYVPSTGIATLS